MSLNGGNWRVLAFERGSIYPFWASFSKKGWNSRFFVSNSANFCSFLGVFYDYGVDSLRFGRIYVG